MEDITKKLEKAQNLNESIQDIEAFLELAKKVQQIDLKNAKSNELSGINKFLDCSISARISSGLPIVEDILRSKKKELSNMLR